MLTLRAKLRNGQIAFTDPVPFALEGEQEVLVTFVQADEQVAVLPRDEHRDCKRYQLEMTASEYQILNLLHQGLGNRQIAAAMGLKEGTIRNSLSDIYRKLNAKNRTEAVSVAIQLGLIDIEIPDSTSA